jgi:hypothetical protein
MQLDPDATLVRAASVVVRLGDSDVVRIDLGGRTLAVPSAALAVLDAFEQPRTIRDVLAELASRGREHFIELSTTLMHLVQAGVLCTPDERRKNTAKLGFVRPAIHIVMLDDEKRTGSFRDALRAVVGKDDVVVDIGTGTGVLAISAAQAGARRVYAIESSAIADVAERVIAANGLADRIEIVRGYSTHVSLPERATVLVTETIGNDPLDEEILEIVSDARARLLAPNARIIPSALELLAVPVDIPENVFARHVFTRARIAAWHEAYGIDFDPLESHRLTATQSISANMAEIAAWSMPTQPVSLVRIDFTEDPHVTLDTTTSCVVTAPASRFGITLAFRATLAPGVVLSTVPGEADARNAWRYLVWPALDLGAVEAGEELRIRHRYERGVTTITFER